MNTEQKKGKNALHTPRVADISKKSRTKVCPEQMVKVLVWANLAGDEELPARLPLPMKGGPVGIVLADLMEALAQLPDALRLHLNELMNRPAEWAEQPAQARKAFKKRFSDPKEAEAITRKMDFRFACQLAAVYRRYKLILAARETINTIVEQAKAKSIPVWSTPAFMTRGPDGRGKYAGDPIGDALLEAEIDYIKRCPRCRIFFYAGKSNVEAYPPPCAAALREQDRKKRRKEEKTRAAEKKGKS